MHVPDSMLHGAICPVTAGVALLGVTVAAAAAAKCKDKPKLTRFAALTAMVFAGQMLNVPITSGVSGHLLGGTLLALLLGAPFAVLAMSLVLAVQALGFADGGLLTMGANVLNMALLGVGVGGLLRSMIKHRPEMSKSRQALLMVAGGWLSVMLAALAVSVELAAGGAVSFAGVAGAMLGTHAWIGCGEGLLTAALYFALAPKTAGQTRTAGAGVPLAVAGAALMLSPWASRLPDGLEKVAAQFGILSHAAGQFAPLAGYRLPMVGHPALTTGLAGLCGTLLVFGSAWILGSRLQYQDRVSVKGR